MWFVHSAKTTGWLRETELVPKTQGILGALKETKFAVNLFKHGKVPLVRTWRTLSRRPGRFTSVVSGSGPRRRCRHRPSRARVGARGRSARGGGGR